MSVLTFSDDFTGPAGAPPDPTKWTVRANGLPLDTQQVLSIDPANCHQDGNGKLAMVAIRGLDGKFTSSYIQSLFTQQYGSFQARIKTPSGFGMWPSFWMVGLQKEQHWPACGEIDIFEQVGSKPNITYAHIHGPGFIGNLIGTGKRLPVGKFSDAFHTYGVTWRPGSIKFTLDGEVYASYTDADMMPGMTWPFEDCGPMCIRLSLAVGGTWPGPPEPAIASATMLVNWVNVWS